MATTRHLLPAAVALRGNPRPHTVLLTRPFPLHAGGQEGGGLRSEVVCDVTIVARGFVAQPSANHRRGLRAGGVASLKYYHFSLIVFFSVFYILNTKFL